MQTASKAIRVTSFQNIAISNNAPYGLEQALN
jgi:hypothetical protein